MNTRVKGRRNEKRASIALEALGFQTQLTTSPTKWALQNDIFGLWDVIAINENYIRCVQVKTNQNAPKAWREKALAWKCPTNCSREVWIYKDRVKEPKIIIL